MFVLQRLLMPLGRALYQLVIFLEIQKELLLIIIYYQFMIIFLILSAEKFKINKFAFVEQ